MRQILFVLLLLPALSWAQSNPSAHAWSPGPGGGTVDIFDGSAPVSLYRFVNGQWQFVSSAYPSSGPEWTITDQPYNTTWEYSLLGSGVSGGAANGRRFNIITGPPPVGYFQDVPETHWAYEFIEEMLERGITSGCGGGNYCPDDYVTRAQMAVFIIRAIRCGEVPCPPEQQ